MLSNQRPFPSRFLEKFFKVLCRYKRAELSPRPRVFCPAYLPYDVIPESIFDVADFQFVMHGFSGDWIFLTKLNIFLTYS